MTRTLAMAPIFFLAACIQEPKSDDQPLDLSTHALSSANSPVLKRAFDVMQAKQADQNAGIWTDPNGCYHYIADRGDAGGYLAPLLAPDGRLLCD